MAAEVVTVVMLLVLAMVETAAVGATVLVLAPIHVSLAAQVATAVMLLVLAMVETAAQEAPQQSTANRLALMEAMEASVAAQRLVSVELAVLEELQQAAA